MSKHKTEETFAAGVHSYGIKCEECGTLPGRWYTLDEVRRAQAQHRRDMRAGKPQGTKPDIYFAGVAS